MYHSSEMKKLSIYSHLLFAYESVTRKVDIVHYRLNSKVFYVCILSSIKNYIFIQTLGFLIDFIHDNPTQLGNLSEY